MIRYVGGSCKWWHFYPYEDFPSLKEKFEEIMEGRAERGLVTRIINKTKEILNSN